MDVTDQDVAALATTARHLMAAKMFSLACCVMLYFDILITFGDEVERIWKQRFSFATVLWFMNRYLSPLGYVVIIASFHMDWPKSVCNRYVLYPEILKVFTAAAIGVIFILRLYSIYGGSMVILVTFSVLLVAELAVKIWAFTDGTSVNLPPGLVGCILTGKGDSNDRFVYTWVAELIFDSIVFVATLSRTLVIYRRHRQGAAIPLIKIMMRDGIIYFLVIFVANLVTVMLFVTLPPDLKAVNASFSTLITSLMVSRLILNLRNQAMRPRANVVSYPSSSQQVRTDQETQDRGITSTFIGNLGEPVENDWFYEDKDEKDFQSAPGNNNNDNARGRVRKGDVYAMENLKNQRNQTETSVGTTNASVAPAFGGQILVAVTQTRSVTSDLAFYNTREGGADGEEDAPAYPSSPPYAYSPYPYRIDRNFRLSHDGRRDGADSHAFIAGSRNPDSNPRHPPSAFSQSMGRKEKTQAQVRPSSSKSARSARSALSAISSAASHVFHRRPSRDHTHTLTLTHAEARQRDDNENYDMIASESGHGHGYGCGITDRAVHSPRPDARLTSQEEREDEEGRRDAASTDLDSSSRTGAHSPGQMRMASSTTNVDTNNNSTGVNGNEKRVRQRGDGGWRPPPTWMLENVDLYELGRPRGSGEREHERGRDRRRRPSTS